MITLSKAYDHATTISHGTPMTRGRSVPEMILVRRRRDHMITGPRSSYFLISHRQGLRDNDLITLASAIYMDVTYRQDPEPKGDPVGWMLEFNDLDGLASWFKIHS